VTEGKGMAWQKQFNYDFRGGSRSRVDHTVSPATHTFIHK